LRTAFLRSERESENTNEAREEEKNRKGEDVTYLA